MRFFRSTRILAFALLTFSLFGQSERGTISGSVKDPSGAVIAGAKVTVINTATNQTSSLTSNGSGDYAASACKLAPIAFE